VKKLKILSVLFAGILALSGCSGQPEDNKTVKEIYYLNFKPEISEAYQEVAKAYEKETGVRVKIVTAASGTYEQTLKSEVAKKDAPVIFQLNGPVGFSAWKNYCADLRNTALYTNLSDKELAITEGDGVFGIPYAVEGYGIIYNDAILQKYFALPQKSTDYTSARDITDFSALRAVVEDMQKNKDALGIQGVFASTSLSSGEQWRWQSHLATVPFYYEFKQEKPEQSTIVTALNSKEISFAYNENMKNIFDLYLNNSVSDPKTLGTKSVADSMAEFALERCAMVQNGDWAWSQVSGVSGNKVKEENIKFLPIYIGTPNDAKQGICIGTESYFAINSQLSDEMQKAGIAFLEWLFTSETGKSFVINQLGFNAPFSTMTELPADPLSREVAYYLNSEKLNIEWTFAGFPSEDFKNVLGDALLQYAQGTKDWNYVVTSTQESWKTQKK